MNIHFVSRQKECVHTVDNARIDAFNAVRPLDLDRDDQEQMIGFSTDVALPQVEQIHVVRQGLAAFNLEKDASAANGSKPIWSQPGRVVKKEVGPLARELQRRS
jgi:hypothetical protein